MNRLLSIPYRIEHVEGSYITDGLIEIIFDNVQMIINSYTTDNNLSSWVENAELFPITSRVSLSECPNDTNGYKVMNFPADQREKIRW